MTTPAAKKKTTKAPAKAASPARSTKPPVKAATGAKKKTLVAKPAARPAARAPVAEKGSAARKVAPKPAPSAKPASAKKPVPKTAAVPHAPSPAPRPASRPAALPAVVAAGVAPKAVTLVGVPTAGAPVAMPPGVVPRKPGRGTPKYFVAPVQAPLPAPTSRFADRFAPPRPPTRQMTKLESDTPRQAHKADPKLANAWKTKSGKDLTDEEVLAMPEAEYMNEKQLEFFRVKLQALKDDLLSNAGETTEHLREDTSIVPDPADRATIEEEHALELRTRDRERKLLKKISQSLGRIESGEYGFCDETGEPIGLGRLIARPTATLSLEAQQRRELKQKMFGD
ncbi:MAG TPA: RNA polymerase-binding protein DksA [Caldimonas sp.]|nr:RNA polymerase-binding protein DksA [Caldimonas sp.]HEX2542341.1 RNA polymerase-binding protein DksA [Caldimonas sp.]